MSAVFHVMTEFSFATGHALVETKKLQNTVENLSSAADEALLKFQRLGMGIVSYMGLGMGSILGLIQTSVQASEKFEMSQRALANIFLTNKLFSGDNAFLDSMHASEAVMNRIQKKAQQFGLAAGPMVDLTKVVGAQLISEKLDDASLKNSIELARGYAKSAGILNFDPNLAIGQLQRTIAGGASSNDPLFRSLMQDTEAMKKFRHMKDPTAAFNKVAPAEKLKILTAALTQFGSEAKIVDENARSLTNQMQVFRDHIVGVFSIFRPLGKFIADFLKKPLALINIYLQHHGKMLVNNFTRMFDGLIKSPKQLYLLLKQLAGVKTDFNKAKNIFTLAGAISLLATVAAYAATQLGYTSASLLMTRLASLTNLTILAGPAVTALWKAGKVFQAVIIGVGEAFAVVAVIFAGLQLIRRAADIASVANKQTLIDKAPEWTAAVVRLKAVLMKLITPLADMFERLAQIVSYAFFRLDFYIDGAVWAIHLLADTLAVLLGTVSAVAYGIAQIINNIMYMVNEKKLINPMAGVWDEMKAGFNDVWDAGFEDIGKDGKGVVNQTQNFNGDFHINNNFKEQMEPDRIAFTLIEQISKAGQNKTQSNQRSLGAPLAGG